MDVSYDHLGLDKLFAGPLYLLSNIVFPFTDEFFIILDQKFKKEFRIWPADVDLVSIYILC